MEILDNMSLGKILDIQEKSESKNCPMPGAKFPSDTPIAMAYVPFQQWEEPYDMQTGLSRGTVFPQLDLPFIGEEAVKNANAK